MTLQTPPRWLVNSFSKALEHLEQNADKNTISIKQTSENETHWHMQQTYILHYVKDNKFSVETYFTCPVSTPINPGPTPFVTVYDSNPVVGAKHDVAFALATLSYNSFLSADICIDGNVKYIVEIRDFTRTQSTGTTATYSPSPPCLQTGYTCSSPGTCSNCCSGAYFLDVDNDEYVCT